MVEAAAPADQVFRALTTDRDPVIAAVAASALAGSDPAVAAELSAGIDTPSPLVHDVLACARRGLRSDLVRIMAELLRVDVFAALELSTLADVARRSAFVEFCAGDHICRAGEVSDTMFVMTSGETEAWVAASGGRRIVGHLSDGAVFGELGVFTGRPRAAWITVTSPAATVVAIPRDAIEQCLGRDPHAIRGILTIVSGYLLDTLAATAAPRGYAPAEQPEAAE